MANYKVPKSKDDLAKLLNGLDINVHDSDVTGVLMDYFISNGDTDISDDSDEPPPDDNEPNEIEMRDVPQSVANKVLDSDDSVLPEGLAQPRRKAPKCAFCGDTGHRNAKKKNGEFLCPLRAAESK